ncbi:hypothetical protein ABT009_38315 [Streptomyces sp. NPDC002896]|uniref:hypothetical protein n=1 Tax=Streptomyces sp. NPDC002896 TaxID=3154438 RepID=UPI003316F206
MTTKTPQPGEPGRTIPVGPAGPAGPAGSVGWGPVPPQPVKKPSRRKTWLTHGAVGLVALVVGTGIGSSGEGANAAASDTAAPKPAVTVTATKNAEAAPAPTVTEKVTAKPKKTKEAGQASSFAGEGEYLVGEDIKAGTYKTAGPEGEFGCYWERAKDASGEFGSIIANNNLEGPGRVTLNNGEYFKTNRCQKWTKVG